VRPALLTGENFLPEIFFGRLLLDGDRECLLGARQTSRLERIPIMVTTLSDLARLVAGHVVGDGTCIVVGANILNAAGPADITLLDSPEKAHLLARSAAGAVLAPRGFELADRSGIQVEDVHAAFAKIVNYFRPGAVKRAIGISPKAIVSATAQIASTAQVYPGATIGDEVEIGAGSMIHSGAHILDGCRIGENVTIFPGAVLYENTRVGARCIIHGGAVLGAYGFGYKLVEGRHVLSSQLGFVELGPEVEVGAGSTIDRGTYGATFIGEGTKIDNLVMIAHNCRIGRHNLICSQVGVAGSTTTGDYVVMAGQVGVRDHVHIGAGAVLGAKAGVSGDVRDGVRMLGTPAVPEREQKLLFATISKLPEMRKQLKELQREMEVLQQHAVKGRSSDIRHEAA
jgi:UDP-3-O-[3-hydroxymyristoyl] glucosamine N-acyltransferase